MNATYTIKGLEFEVIYPDTEGYIRVVNRTIGTIRQLRPDHPYWTGKSISQMVGKLIGGEVFDWSGAYH